LVASHITNKGKKIKQCKPYALKMVELYVGNPPEKPYTEAQTLQILVRAFGEGEKEKKGK